MTLRSLEAASDFGDAVGSSRMIGAGHHDFATEIGDRPRDPVVVGRNDDSL